MGRTSHWQGVGIATGWGSGLVAVVSTDAEGYETLMSLCGGIPDAGWIARLHGTIGWKLAFLYALPANRPPSYSYAGLEIVSDGGYIIAPPTACPTGAQLVWSVRVSGGREERDSDTFTARMKGKEWRLDPLPEVFLAFAHNKLQPGKDDQQSSSGLPPPRSPVLEARVFSALTYLPPDNPIVRRRVAQALKWTLWPSAREILSEWLAQAHKPLNPYDVDVMWQSASATSGALLQDIFDDAMNLGWTERRDVIDELSDTYTPIMSLGGHRAVLSYPQVPVNGVPVEKWPVKLTWQSANEWSLGNGGAKVTVPVSIDKDGKEIMGLKDARSHFLNCDRVGWFRSTAVVPGGPSVLPGNYLNLYQGWGVEPVEGDCAPFERYLLEVWCNGDYREAFQYLRNWQFWGYQHPAEVSGTGLVGTGPPGSGRSLLCAVNSAIFGLHSRELTAMQVQSHFTPWALDTCLCVADGALRGGAVDTRIVGDWITARHLPIKDTDIEPIPSHLKLIIVGEGDDLITLKPGDTRFAAYHLSDRYAYTRPGPNRDAFWREVWGWFEHGGPAHWLHKGLKADLGAYHPRQVIDTANRLEQKRKNMSGLERGWGELLGGGEVPDLVFLKRRMWQGVARPGCSWVSRETMKTWARQYEPEATAQRINDFLRGVGCTERVGHLRVGRGAKYGWALPEFVQARVAWSVLYGVEFKTAVTVWRCK